MSDERTGRELTPARRRASPATPVPDARSSSSVERFSAGPADAHRWASPRSARPRSSARAATPATSRSWRSCSSPSSSPSTGSTTWACPALGIAGPDGGRRPRSSSSRTWSVATRCSSPTAPAATARSNPATQGGIGPPLNDQAKLYNAINQNGGSGTGHLNPNYIHKVLDGRRPLRVRRRQQRHARLAPAQRAAQLPPGRGAHRLDHGQHDVSFTYDPHAAAMARRPIRGDALHGDRLARPSWERPGATPPPACWRPYEPGVPPEPAPPRRSRPSPTRAPWTRRGPSRST